MPLYKIINHDSDTQIFVWKITETFEALSAEVPLREKSQLRVAGMKSELHQRAFLSVRKLLHAAGYSDADLYYDAFGKPYFVDGKHISISHSHAFSSIIVSDRNTGIDLEMQREKITTIAHKFADTEARYLDSGQNDYIRKLTVIWGAKEAIFKIRNEAGISFKDHIGVSAFEINQKQTKATLNFNNNRIEYNIFFEEIENFTLVYAFEN